MRSDQSVMCESLRRLNRRQWQSRLAASLGGISLTAVANRLALAGESSRRDDVRAPGKARSLIMLWMQGGPSQLDTFDPHPGSPIGGTTQEIETSLSGARVASSLKQTAALIDRVTLARSIVSKEGDHERATYQLKTGWRPDPTLVHPSLGAIVCHQTNDTLDIPRHISILGRQWPARGGYLGPSFDAFQIGDPRNRVPNLRAPASDQRLKNRLEALSSIVEREFAKNRFKDMDALKTQHETATARAIAMMTSDQVAAFDVTHENEELVAEFGDHPFGRGCLAAARLVETGVRCIEVELSGWDSHANNDEIQRQQGAILDKGLASLIRLLEKRNLFESTIVVCGGEFGRSPDINSVGGRDHWQHGFSWLIAGGPTRRGLVYGETSAEVSKDKEDRTSHIQQPLPVADLHATLLDSLGVDPSAEVQTPVGRPMVFSEGSPVAELIG